MSFKLNIKILPNAKKNEIVQFENNTLKIRITAPPVDGKANETLIKFLSKEWKIAKSQINILKGLTSRQKTIEVPDCVKKTIAK
ncbi:MAG: DUF167 domain-containing protein [bacterium]|nr:YggU family protein [bacterium]MBU1917869.1 YggU family protein [bacterium]